MLHLQQHEQLPKKTKQIQPKSTQTKKLLLYTNIHHTNKIYKNIINVQNWIHNVINCRHIWNIFIYMRSNGSFALFLVLFLFLRVCGACCCCCYSYFYLHFLAFTFVALVTDCGFDSIAVIDGFGIAYIPGINAFVLVLVFELELVVFVNIVSFVVGRDIPGCN